MHRLNAVAHKSSTSLCTASRRAPLVPCRPPAVDQRAGACGGTATRTDARFWAWRRWDRARTRPQTLAVAFTPTAFGCGAAAWDLTYAPGRDPGHRGWHSGDCRRGGPRRRRSCPGRIRPGPPCMRWGAWPASPCQVRPVAWLCWRRALPAGAGHPSDGPVSRLLPRSSGRPKVVPVSNGESIFTAFANTAQEPEVNYFWVSPLSTRCPQKEGSYPRLMVVIHRLIHRSSTSDPA